MTLLARLAAGALLAAALAAAAATAAGATPAYRFVPGPYRASPRFRVSYTGIGFYRTVYHAHPPNPGGADDRNAALDSSAQGWSIRFGRTLALSAASVAATRLDGAVGATTATGEVRHVHVDGLYRALDASETCRMRSHTTRRTPVDAALDVRYVAASRSFELTAHEPVATVLAMFPLQCPGQGDSIDGMADFYAPPGFSFATGYGPERWFEAAPVAIPAAVLHRAAEATIPIVRDPGGAPPPDCAVANAFERCATGGSWTGVVTLRAVSN